MNSDNLVSQFIDLVRCKKWHKIEELPANEMQIILKMVRLAGFEPKAIVPGRLRGDYLDQDGSKTGQTFSINSYSPFKVISQNGSENYFSTGWLDCAFRRVLESCGETRQQLIRAIELEIERSIPLVPIQITPEGDMLCECPPSLRSRYFEYFVDHTRDKDVLEYSVGVAVHMYCNNSMGRGRATKELDAIICRGCGLRVLFPKEVKTYGDLRQAFASYKS